MPQDFRLFLSGLPLGDYCIDCLSRVYESKASMIRDYLRVNGLVARQAECRTCGKRTETFRPPVRASQ